MEEYKITIGLEVHSELLTKSKMFCGCLNSDVGVEPNSHICPICMGHPGTLPVINKEAVKKVLLVGAAVDGGIADFTEWDRKNYFYPDIPKGYQISQYKYPLVSNGELNGVKLTRIHLEEDTARSSHESGDFSMVDFNRAGVPLMELVTEPVMHSAGEAVAFAKELQLLLQYLGASGANMEKGEMRVEVNMSVAKDGGRGTKVEVKNINSFRAVARTVEYEFERQTKLLERGEKVVQETRGWDESKQATVSQRLKESAHDYRYFPDPDLPKLITSEIPEFSVGSLKKDLPELPSEKRNRYAKDFGIKKEDIEVYVTNREAGEFFESVVKSLKTPESKILASNYITSDIIGLSKSTGSFSAGNIASESFVKLIEMMSSGDLSSRAGKDILKMMFDNGGDPEVIAKENNLIQKSDPEELKKIIQIILDKNAGVAEDFKNGKESVIQFLVGQGMKETKGSANPEVLKKIILKLLK